MRVPQVSERIKEAPAQALRGVFAGIGQLLLITDKLRNKPSADRDVPRAWTPGASETITVPADRGTATAAAAPAATPEAAAPTAPAAPAPEAAAPADAAAATSAAASASPEVVAVGGTAAAEEAPV